MDYGALWERTKTALAEAYEDLVGFGVGIVEAIVVTIVAIAVARFLRRRVRRAFAGRRLDPHLATLAANGVSLAAYVIAATVILALLGATWTALVAVLGVGTVAVSLSLQDLLKSVVAGAYLLLERPFTIGDRVRVKDAEGRVEGIDIRITALRTDAGERVLVPNSTVFAEVVVNRSAADVERTMMTLKGLSIPPGDVAGAVSQALAGMDQFTGPAPQIAIVAASSEGLEVAVGLTHPADVDVVPAVVSRLRERFPEASVVIGQT